MIKERDIIAFEVTKIPVGQRVLVFAPHADDETIGCGGTITLLTQAGNPVKIINVTDGRTGDFSKRYDPQEYVQIRQNELRAAAQILGTTDVEFWDYRCESLHITTELIERCLECFYTFQPQLVLCPAPTEIHPDHRTTAHLVWETASQLSFPVHIWFYETLTPIRPNTLIDITSVIDRKKRALQAFPSQLAENHYERILGLNEYRTLSLIQDKYRYAEAFWAVNTAMDHYPSLAQVYLQQQQVDVIHKVKTGPQVSIIVRTKNRPHLLAEALQSIVNQTYSQIEVVIVNDGGNPIDDLLETFRPALEIRLVTHEKSGGEAKAASSGLKHARGKYLMFLDDDDLLYPEHCEILVDFLEHHDLEVAYTDTCCAFYERDTESGDYRLKEKKVIFSNDFDRSAMLFENLTPIMCVMFSNVILQHVPNFSEDIDIYDDWDFWVRVSRKFDFQHLRVVTSEYRIFTDRQGAYAHDNSPKRDYWLGYAFEKHRHLITGMDHVAYQRQIQAKIRRYESRIEELEQQVSALRDHAQTLEDFAIRVRRTLPFKIYQFFRDLWK
ncbi:MAG: glycosyltransferase [Gemmatimonadetes bacterium]|nr:MAG: glycosyltransferase [Gemmatimonadota bacterium]